MMLEEYLNDKPLYYDEIDYSRMPKIYEKIKEHFKIPKIVHVIGTNGKGTTGRFLAAALYSRGFNIGHYTSPHILEFNERIWLNGRNSTDSELGEAHMELQKILTKADAHLLSYFEYTTLLSMIVFKKCDFIVMEAGLGGEHDATSVFPKILTLVTPIGHDHEAFLGSTISQIASTKLNAIQNNAIIANQIYDEVNKVVQKKGIEKSINIYRIEDFLKEEDREKIALIKKELSLADYLSQNLSLSIAALNFLNIPYASADFKNSTLFGRLSRLSENIIVDVGHNLLAASSIVQALQGEKYVLIYNSYKDKNYKEILATLKPIILHVEIIEVDNQRVESTEVIKNVLNNLDIKYSMFKNIIKDEKYLVFGSFSVVERFLREYNG